MQAFFILVIRHSHTVRCRKPERLARATNHSTTMNQSRTWSEKEIRDLRARYTTTPWPELMQIFGRSQAAILHKAQKLGISRASTPVNKWSNADVETLRALYPTTSAAAIAALLGRAETAVLKKVQKLGIQKKLFDKRLTGKARSRPWTPSEDATLKASYGKKMAKKLALQLGRTEISVRMRAYKLRLVGTEFGYSSPIGTERVYRGIPERKVSSTGVRNKDWRRIDVLEWEAIHGPVPAGMVLMKKPGMPRTPENLELVSPADIPMLAPAHNADAELRQLMVLKQTIGSALARIEKSNCDDKNFRSGRDTDWTREQVEYLEKNISTQTLVELAKALGRTRRAVEHKRIRMELPPARNMNDWPEPEKVQLAKIYPNTDYKELALFFGRSRRAINAMASRMGLKKDRQCTNK
ncbi:hypothetical protein DETS111669_16155 [Delftia tsuruhatensis]